ncbi:hypothetical protein VQ643_04380 [Pseudomonas sp. F1_0610]|uniref:hypothetical protein n=1 Tax=Pseudomonas sp. F1_0610 TaxID=3114284 RepID=UPI0039C4C3E0
MIYYQIAILVVSLIVSYAMQPKPKSPKPAAIDDFNMPNTDEGTEQSVIFGDCWISGWQVLSYGNLRTSKIKTKSGK